MRIILIALSLILATSCKPQDGEIDAVLPVDLTVSTTYTPGQCLDSGQIALINLFTKQGHAELAEIKLSRQVDFGNHAKLTWTDGEKEFGWDHKALAPRRFRFDERSTRLGLRPDATVTLILTVDPDDCHDYGGQREFVESVGYLDHSTGEKRTLKVGA